MCVIRRSLLHCCLPAARRIPYGCHAGLARVGERSFKRKAEVHATFLDASSISLIRPTRRASSLASFRLGCYTYAKQSIEISAARQTSSDGSNVLGLWLFKRLTLAAAHVFCRCHCCLEQLLASMSKSGHHICGLRICNILFSALLTSVHKSKILRALDICSDSAFQRLLSATSLAW